MCVKENEKAKDCERDSWAFWAVVLVCVKENEKAKDCERDTGIHRV